MAAEEKTESIALASSSGGSKLVTILTIVNVAATLGMGGVLLVSFHKEKTSTSVEDISTQPADHDEAQGEKAKEGAGGHGGGEAKESSSKKKHDFGKMVTLEQFTVNLSTPGSVNPKFVRVNISLEVPSEDSESEVNTKMPQIRNTIIDLFNSKRAADLATAEGRDYLKEEIRNALNGFMVTGKVKGVYFTNFAVSS
jgi:flagellar protein FliL